MPSADRPHIILIMTDQQRYDTIRALGFPHMDTPHLDRLVREGTSFSHCYVTAPSCAPSRASLFTGLHPHVTGIYRNADRWTRTWVEQLQAGGYYCVNVGKMHTYPYHAPAGFHERYVVENKDRFLEERWYFDEWDKALAARGLTKPGRVLYRQRPDYRESLGAFAWTLPEDMHPDVFVGGMACWWLETKPPPAQPLFLQVGFPGPHPPYDPPQRYADPYLARDLGLADITPADLANQPRSLRHLREHNFRIDHDSVVHLADPTPEQRQRQRAFYLGNVTLIDEQIGRLLTTLEQRGYLENAVVIFTSDHGDCLTDHGHSQKWTMYEEIVRVPTVIRMPDGIGGTKIDAMVQSMDLGPTVLELAGLKQPAWMEARSLVPALQDPAAFAGRDYVIAAHGRDGILDGTDMMMMIRDHRWKLVTFIDHDDGQLFDLEHDPREVTNRWGDPAPEAVAAKTRLREALLQQLMLSQYHTRTWAEAAR